MKKTMMIIALFVVLMISMASRSDRDYQAAKGFSAPELELVGGSDRFEVEGLGLKRRFVFVGSQRPLCSDQLLGSFRC